MAVRRVAMVWKGRAERETLVHLLGVLQSQFAGGGNLGVDLVRSPAGGSLEMELEIPGDGSELLRQLGRMVQRAGGQLFEKGGLEAANSNLLLPTSGPAQRFEEPSGAAAVLEQHLSQVAAASSLDFRRSRRIDVRLPTEVWSGDRYSSCTATNLSLGGMFVRTDLRPVFQSQVRVRTPLFSGELLVATATVVHILDLAKDGGLGLEFVYDPALQEQVGRYLTSLSS